VIDCQRNYNAGGVNGVDFNDVEEAVEPISEISVWFTDIVKG